MLSSSIGPVAPPLITARNCMAYMSKDPCGIKHDMRPAPRWTKALVGYTLLMPLPYSYLGARASLEPQ